MKAIDYFHREHAVLLEIVGRVERALGEVRADAMGHQRVLRKMSELRGGVLLHIITEDGDFYPRVARCGDHRLTQAIHDLRRAAGGIERQFDTFLQEWGQPRHAVQSWSRFIGQAREILVALQFRIIEEERIFQLIAEQGIDLTQLPEACGEVGMTFSGMGEDSAPPSLRHH